MNTLIALALCASGTSPITPLDIRNITVIENGVGTPLLNSATELSGYRILSFETTLDHHVLDPTTGALKPEEMDVRWRMVAQDGTVMGGPYGWYGLARSEANVTLLTWNRATGEGDFRVEIPLGDPSRHVSHDGVEVPLGDSPYLAVGDSAVELEIGPYQGNQAHSFSTITASGTISLTVNEPNLLVRASHRIDMAPGDPFIISILRPQDRWDNTETASVEFIGSSSIEFEGTIESQLSLTFEPNDMVIRLHALAATPGTFLVKVTSAGHEATSRTVSVARGRDSAVVEDFQLGIAAGVSSEGLQLTDPEINEEKRCRMGYSTPGGTGSVDGKSVGPYSGAPPPLNCGTSQKAYYYPTRCLKASEEVCVRTGGTSNINVTRLDYVGTRVEAAKEESTGEEAEFTMERGVKVFGGGAMGGGGTGTFSYSTTYVYYKICEYAINPDESVSVTIANCQ